MNSKINYFLVNSDCVKPIIPKDRLVRKAVDRRPVVLKVRQSENPLLRKLIGAQKVNSPKAHWTDYLLIINMNSTLSSRAVSSPTS